MSADLARIESDITEALRRLRIAREAEDHDAEVIFENAIERLFEFRASVLYPGRHRATSA